MKIKLIAAALAAFFMLPLLCGTAYAYGDDPDGPVETPEATSAPDAPITDYPETPPKPFTPAGTGTVIDNATDEVGKEFFTIMTPDENVFYLVIDRQRGTENVYFLNAVTEADLLALAEIPEKPAPAPVEPTPAPIEPEPDPAPAPEQGGGNMGMIVFVAVLLVLGGGAGWYFKIYRPKQQKAGMEDDYGGDESDPYDDNELDAEPEDDSPPWYDNDEMPDGDGGDE